MLASQDWGESRNSGQTVFGSPEMKGTLRNLLFSRMIVSNIRAIEEDTFARSVLEAVSRIQIEIDFSQEKRNV
jgi:hypothetical protein